MSTILMAQCWPLQKMSVAQKAVLISLADQANDGGVCWPGVKTIAMRTCLSERAVQEALAWLQAVGLVFREYREHASTYYTIRPAAYDPSAAPAKRKRATPPGADGAPGAPYAGGADGAPWGADGAPGGADGAPPPPQMAHHPPADGAPKSSINRNLNLQGTISEPLQQALPAAEFAGVIVEKAKKPRKPAGGDAANAELQSACRAVWSAYRGAYAGRYGQEPVRNEKINAQVKSFVKRLPRDEAADIAAWYVSSVNSAKVVGDMHSFGLLLASAEAYRTQWANGRAMTSAQASKQDRTANASNTVADAVQILMRMQTQGQTQGGSHA